MIDIFNIPLMTALGAHTSTIQSLNLTQWYTNGSLLQCGKLSQFFLCDLLCKSMRFSGQASTLLSVLFVPKHISFCNIVYYSLDLTLIYFVYTKTQKQDYSIQRMICLDIYIYIYRFLNCILYNTSSIVILH